MIERVKPPDKGRTEYWDTIVPGLGLRVTAKGHKSFCVMYRINGALRRYTIGSWPAWKLTKDSSTGPQGVRDKAREVLRVVDEGRDPALEKTETRADKDTVGAVVEEFNKRHLSKLKDGRRAHRILENHVVKKWKHLRLGSIRRRDVISLIDDVADTAPGAANKVRAWLHKLFAWAVSRDIVEVNPVIGVPRPHKTRERERVLTDQELQVLWQVLETEGYPWGPLVKLMLLTGQRRSEVAGMKWQDIDMDEKLWEMQDTKGGRAHIVPLAPETLGILKSMPQVDDVFVFTTTGRSAVSGFGRMKERLDRKIDEAIGDKSKKKMSAWTLHDLRRTVRTRLGKLGVAKHVSDRDVGHATPDVSRIYDRWGYLPEKRAALELWENSLLAIMEGSKGPADVVSLDRAARTHS